jgi:hypothetical protein
MRSRLALLSAVVLLPAGAVLSAAALTFTTTGTVVSTSRDSLVVKIDDHGHRIPFAIEKPSVLPSGLAVGSRVSVTYHPTGSTGQAADSVTLISAPTPKVHHSKTTAPARKSLEQPSS